MEYTTLRVFIPDTHLSGLDVSMESLSWQRTRPCVLAVSDVPTNGTGVSAGVCRT